MASNPATPLRLKIEIIAKNLHKSYSDLNEVYKEVLKVEGQIDRDIKNKALNTY